MKTQLKIFLSLLALVLTGLPLFAQIIPLAKDTTTLDGCIRMARLHYPALQAADAERRMQHIMSGTVATLGRTDISGMAGQYNSGYFDVNVGVSQQILNPTLARAQRAVYSREAEVAEKQYLLVEKQLVRQVRSYFFTWAAQHERLLELRQQDSLFSEMEHIAATRLRTGEGNSLALLNVQVKRAELRRNMLNVRQDSAIAQARLRMLIGSDEPLALSKGSTWRMKPVLRRSSNHPLLAVVSSAEKATYAQQAVAQARSKPDYSLGVYNQSLTAPRDGVSALARFSYLQATISLPFNRKPYRVAAEVAAIATQQARAATEAADKTLRLSRKEAEIRQENAQTQVAQFEQEWLRQSQALIDLARKNYLAAEIGYVEYMQSIESAYIVRLSYIDAVEAFNQAAVELAYWVE